MPRKVVVVTTPYDLYASTYDRVWAKYSRNSHAQVLAALDPAPITALLDIGAGTGELLRRLAAALPDTTQLAGIEPSAGMLNQARRKFGARPNVTLAQGEADKLPFDDRSFDAIVSANVFHYLPDPAHALGEMWRVLVPGGQLVLVDYSRHTAAPVATLVHMLDRGQVRSYQAAEVAALVRVAGLVVAQRENIRFTSFWGGWLVAAHKPKS